MNCDNNALYTHNQSNCVSKFHCIICLKKENRLIGYLYSSLLARDEQEAELFFKSHCENTSACLNCDVSANILNEEKIKQSKPIIDMDNQYVFLYGHTLMLEYTNEKMKQCLIDLLIRLFK